MTKAARAPLESGQRVRVTCAALNRSTNRVHFFVKCVVRVSLADETYLSFKSDDVDYQATRNAVVSRFVRKPRREWVIGIPTEHYRLHRPIVFSDNACVQKTVTMDNGGTWEIGEVVHVREVRRGK